VAAAARDRWASASVAATRACRAVRAVARSVGAVVALEVVAAYSCCDAASMTAVHSQEAAAVAWTVARAAARSDGATPEAADATVMVSGSMGSVVAMVEVGLGPVADGVRL
jgi:hypothetical protein